MRIVHVSSSLDPKAGGTVTALNAFARGQRNAGFDVRVLSTWTQGETRVLAEALRSQGIEVREVGPCRTRLRLHPNLKRAVEEMIADADIVHVHALWEQIQHLSCRTAHRRGIPYVISTHGMADPWSLRQSRLKKQIYRMVRLNRNVANASALVFTTPIEQRLVQETFGWRGRCVLEPYGMDLSEFEHLPPKGRLRERLGLEPDRPIVLFLSRVHYKKGLDLLIPAFAKAAVGNDAVLVIAGPGEEDYIAKVMQSAKEAEIGDRVLMTGMLYGVERIEAMVDSQLFTLPSYQENFGIVVIEAMAASLPVVISDQVNLYPIVEESECGYVVPTQVEPLASRLRELLTEVPRREEMAARGRKYIWEHMDCNRIGERWRGHYAELLAEKRS